MQYTGTSEEFTARFNNNRCAHGNYRKKKNKKNMEVKQESLQTHFADDVPSGEGD